MQAAFVVTESEQVFATVFDGENVVAAMEVEDPDPARLRELGQAALESGDPSDAIEVAFALKAGAAFEVVAHLEANI